MTTNDFTLLMLVCVPVAACLIVVLFRFEKRLGRARPRSGLLLFPLLFGVLYLFYLDGAMQSDRGIAFMRQQLDIPDDVAIKTHNGGKKSPICYRDSAFYRASAQFSPQQFSRYLAATFAPELWRPLPASHFDEKLSHFTFAEDALQWRDLPAPRYYGSQQLVYKIAGEDVRGGREFCYDINPVADVLTAPVRDAKPAYSVTACGAVKRSKTPVGGGQIKAVLDFDTQRLVVAMHFDRRAAYCNNRISNGLNERLTSVAN
jgi:hypothetical protein